ncbi:protein CHUP1, chloroplastic-like [Olea europaea var. sylvestris]|uniref:protein CHUP1, chloroplastic-like n=1 Tax=Olea europaea var. sylvestris TaxID=158386 RepID=UPI000C1D2E4A|nr:protein CHUP1, chloroplastic-like [Olea europaea var. sylvestris]
MREENSSDNRVKSSKFADQNQVPKGNNSIVKGNSNSSKTKSSWGSHIVKGFTAAEKKTKNKVQTTTQGQKLQLAGSAGVGNQKNQSAASQSRIKRSLIGDLSCSIYATQIHPHTVNGNTKTKSLGGSQDLFLEIDHLRSLLQDSKDRESKLQAELSEYTRNPKVLELEIELELKKSEIDGLVRKVGLLECERDSLSEQLMTLNSVSEKQDELSGREEHENSRGIEMEIVELRRLNKELQLQKRNLTCRISSLESQLANLAKVSESDIVEKIKSEASVLRHANEDLCKQVEGLQMNRLNEVEELVYLRWVNSCLRNELNNSLTVNSNKASTPVSVEKGRQSICFSSFQTNEESNNSATKTLNLIKKLKKWPITDEDIQQLECTENYANRNWDDLQNSARRHSISGSKCCHEDLILAKRRQSDGFICSKEAENADASQKYDLGVINSKVLASLEVEKRTLRVPNPPPRPSCTSLCGRKEEISIHSVPLPPPPPPPPIGEIETRSSHLIAIKADVETQGEFVNFLIQEVNDAVYQNIEDVVEFVKWLDDELCFLVDERAVLKHFNWPEKKADTLREAAFGYRDLKKLEQEVSNFQDDSRMLCDIALKKMVSLSERMERTVYNILRTRDSLMRHCKEFQIPTDWMLDTGILSKIKFGSVKLAKMYMKRVATELQSKGTSDKDSSMDYMLLQGVRYAFRIHQFAGGFDAETMHAFEELRDLAVVLNKK